MTVFLYLREIEGQTYTGEVKEKEKAKKQYEKAVSTGQTAGLVKWVDQGNEEGTNMMFPLHQALLFS